MSTYLKMPVVKCHLVSRDVGHMAHVFDDEERGEKVVCRGLLPHSVPLNTDACLVLVEFGPEPGHSRCCGLPLPCRLHDGVADQDVPA